MVNAPNKTRIRRDHKDAKGAMLMRQNVNTEYLKLDGGSIAYDDNHAEGELLILLPGVGALRSEYRYLTPVLEKAGYRVVTVDLRGHGESSVGWKDYTIAASGADILALIEHLKGGPAHVIATSFSPGAAVWAAAEQPQAIRSLTLIAAFVRDPKPNLMTALSKNLFLRGPWKVTFWGMFYQTLYPSQKPEDFKHYLKKLKASLREPGRFEALRALAFAPKMASEQRLQAVKAPSLVLMGTKDPDWPDPVAEAQFVQEKLSAKLALIEGAGHYPQTEMPESTAAAIMSFLEALH